MLFQFAPWVHFEPRRLDYLASLPERLPGCRVAVEFRHRSWFPDHADEALGALRAAGLAHVVVDAPAVAGAMPHVTAVTAPTAVLRLHGRNAEGWLRQLRGEEPSVREKYDYLYSDAELAALVPEIGGLVRGQRGGVRLLQQQQPRLPGPQRAQLKRLLGQRTDGEVLQPGLFNCDSDQDGQ